MGEVEAELVRTITHRLSLYKGSLTLVVSTVMLGVLTHRHHWTFPEYLVHLKLVSNFVSF